MKKKRGLTLKINLSNRWIYFLITLGILAVIGVGVYALVPGGNPPGTPSQNPGHLISKIDPPAGCTSGQFLQWDGTTNDWKCASSSGCDVSGKCSQICIGTDCRKSWNNGIKIYLVTNPYCDMEGEGIITSHPACSTDVCSTADQYNWKYYKCDGTCGVSRISPLSKCNNELQGYLVS